MYTPASLEIQARTKLTLCTPLIPSASAKEYLITTTIVFVLFYIEHLFM